MSSPSPTATAADDVVERADRYEVVGRRWKYAPPPWRMVEALTAERHRWLELLDEETEPELVQPPRPNPLLVVFCPWLTPVIDSVSVEVATEGAGSSLRVLATAAEPPLSEDERRSTRYRLGTLFGSKLRTWVDDPHW